MDFKRRIELFNKLLALVADGQGVVVCGSGFFFEIFANFALSQFLNCWTDEIADISWSNGAVVDFHNGARLSVFDVKKDAEVSRFVADYTDPASFPLELMILIEPVGDSLKDVYNAQLLPLLLNREKARVQVVRPG